MAPSPFTRRTVLGALLAGAVVGCARGGTDTPASGKPADSPPRSPPPESPAAPESPESPQESSSAEQPDGPLVSMRVSGGYAGVEKRITVAPDGACTAEVHGASPASGRLPGAEVSRLRGLLEEAHFGRLPSRMTDPDSYDLFQYRVTYEGRTVHTDLTRETPSLKEAIGILNRTIGRLVDQ